MDIARRLGKFVQKIAEGLRSADKRFVGDCIRGMAQSGSTMLTENGRAPWKKIQLLLDHDVPLAEWPRQNGSTMSGCGRSKWRWWLWLTKAAVRGRGSGGRGQALGKGSKDRVHWVRFTFTPVRLKDLPKRRGLAQIGRSARIMLLCWKLPENAKEALMLTKAYLRRF